MVALFAWMLIEVPWALLPLGSRSKKRSPLTARQVFLLLLLAFLYLSALVALAASLQWLYFTFAPIVRSASADDIVLWTGIVVAVWLVASAWITHSILAYADSRPPRPRWPRDRFPTNDARIAQPYEPFGPEGELNARTLLRRPGTPIQGKKSGGL